MITAAHMLIFTQTAPEVRAFLRDVLELPSVDAGEGWLIFRLPAAEVGVHPAEGNGAELWLMCDDIEATVDELAKKGAEFAGPVTDQGFGRVARLKLPGGAELPVYQPRHPTAFDLPG